ncbi:MAG: YIP1 family protein [Candidatus Marinimicrobia bacterium]|nr:YIP1 family protein [Candidatus Neomarinimicrobiota bacterium]
MNVFSRIGNVFVAPTACFTSLRDEGKKWTDYVVPFLLLLAMLIVFLIVTSGIMEKLQVEIIQNMSQLSDAQKEAALQNANSPIANIFKYVGGVLQVAIGVLISGLIMWVVGNFIGGGDQKFGTMLVAALYIQMITIPESLIKMFLVLQKGAMTVQLGFGSLLANPDTTSYGVQLINQLEFFAIWRIIVWIIAFKVLYKFNTKKSTLLVVITLLIGMAIMAALGTMQAGRMG